MAISPMAVVDPKAELAPDVEVGPFVVIGPDVRIDEGTTIHQGATIVGKTDIGRRNVFFPHACIGTPPQDLGYADEPTRVIIGDENIFREFVTVHRASTKENGVTRIGNCNYLMAVSHVAHDCLLGDNILFGNNVLIGGHVTIDSHVILSGGSGVHPFTTIGRFSYVGGLSRILQDVPPFMIVDGRPPRVRRVNVVGLTRGNFSEESISAIEKAHRKIYNRGRVRSQALDQLSNSEDLTDEVQSLVVFLREKAKSPIGRYRETLYRNRKSQ